MHDALDEVGAGSARAFALSGEAGIGKSRLLSELAVVAADRGHVVLSGRAAEFEQDLPFGVFVDALDEFLRDLDPHRAQRLGSELGGELGHLFPALAWQAGSWAPGLQDERYRAHRAVRALLEHLATPAPLVLLLDDVHWADHASIELVSALLRRPPKGPVLLAVSLRPRQADKRLASVLEHACREGLLDRLDLCPLTPHEAEQLLTDVLRPSLRATLYAQAGGNPFYLEELARSLGRTAYGTGPVDEGGNLERGAQTAIPSAITVAIAQELGLLGTVARRLLDGAAVAGDRFDPELAAAAAGLPEAAAFAALDELLELDLVRATEVPRRFRFRHPLLRSAAYQATRGGWRLAAHERTAAALAARGAAPSARAHHVEQSARVGDQEAIRLLSEAGKRAAQHAPGSAARWYAAAIRLLPEEGREPMQHVELLVDLALSLSAIGSLEDSRAAILQALELLPEQAGGLRVRLLGTCAEIEHLLGRRSDAYERLMGALADVDDPNSPQAVALMIELAVSGYYKTDFEQMREWAEQALANAQRLGTAPLIAAATAILAMTRVFVGDIVEGQRYCDRAARLIDALPDSELATRLDAALYAAWAEFYLARCADAYRHSQRGLAIARGSGQGRLIPQFTQVNAGSLAGMGRLVEATDIQERAVEAARLSGNLQSLIWTLANYAMTTIDRDAHIALRAAEESVELMGEREDNVIFAWARIVLAMVRGELGEADRCANGLLEAAGGAQLPLVPVTTRPFLWEVLTRAELARGRVVEANEAARHAEATAERLGLPFAMSCAQLARAAVLLAEKRPGEAAETALTAAAQAETVGARIDAARAHALAGRALVSAGLREQGAAELEAAATELDQCGADRLRDTSERALRRLGRRFHRRSDQRAGIGTLTARELQIADLVTERKTNREIAAELFLSDKTVESHLRNIFGKLGITSRRAVGNALEHLRQQDAT